MFHVVHFGGAAVDVLHDGAHRGTAAAVVALDQVVDFRAQADAQRHRAAGRQRHRLQRVGIGGIGHHQREAAGAVVHRHHVLLLEEAQREFEVGGGEFRRVARGQHRYAQQLGPGLGQFALVDQAEPRQQRRQAAFGGLLVQPPRPREVAVLQPPARHQQRAHRGLALVRRRRRPLCRCCRQHPPRPRLRPIRDRTSTVACPPRQRYDRSRTRRFTPAVLAKPAQPCARRTKKTGARTGAGFVLLVGPAPPGRSPPTSLCPGQRRRTPRFRSPPLPRRGSRCATASARSPPTTPPGRDSRPRPRPRGSAFRCLAC